MNQLGISEFIAQEKSNISLIGHDNENIIDISEILKLTASVSGPLSINEIKITVIGALKKLYKANAATLYMLDDKKEKLIFDVVDSLCGFKLKNLDIPITKGVVGHVIRNKKSLLVGPNQNHSLIAREFDSKSGFATRNMICSPIIISGEIIGALQVLNKMDGEFNDHDLKILDGLSGNIGMAITNAKINQKLQDTLIQTIGALADTIGLRDGYTGEHTKRTQKYAMSIGQLLGLDEDRLNTLSRSALLHDIGKTGICDAILRKDGRLTDDEYNEIKSHPISGAKLIENIDFLSDAIPGIIQHHERIDGKGYPYGLKGEQISLEGRIITVADSYDAMTTDRPYRKGLDHETAKKILIEGKGTQFDGDLVEVFLKTFEDDEITGK
ncbi:MAG: HD domain-containing phosphohydrolase [Candidatus Absconditabacteria bacterium]